MSHKPASQEIIRQHISDFVSRTGRIYGFNFLDELQNTLQQNFPAEDLSHIETDIQTALVEQFKKYVENGDLEHLDTLLYTIGVEQLDFPYSVLLNFIETHISELNENLEDNAVAVLIGRMDVQQAREWFYTEPIPIIGNTHAFQLFSLILEDSPGEVLLLLERLLHINTRLSPHDQFDRMMIELTIQQHCPPEILNPLQAEITRSLRGSFNLR